MVLAVSVWVAAGQDNINVSLLYLSPHTPILFDKFSEIMATLHHDHYDHAQSRPRCSPSLAPTPSRRTTPSRDLDLALALPIALVLSLALALTGLCGSIFLVCNDLFSPHTAVSAESFGGEEDEEEESDLEGTAPTSKRRKLAREKALNNPLESGNYSLL